MIHSCTTGSLFSSPRHRNGLLIIGAIALIAFIYRRSIQNFLCPENRISPQHILAKPPIPRNFTAVQIPSNVTITYQGSNAEYIVFKKDGSKLTEQEYFDLAVPILKLQFPRNREVEKMLSPEILDQLDQNETVYIDQKLDAIGLKAIKIPKTLYDIFHIAFRFSTSASSLKEENACLATVSLENLFLESTILLARHHPDGDKLIVQEEEIHKAFAKADSWKPVSVDAGLNNYIFQNLTEKKYIQETLSWEAIVSVVDDLFRRIERLFQENQKEFDGLYQKKCPAKKCKVSGSRDYLDHWNHYIFGMRPNFSHNQTKILTVFKKALWHEFSQDSSIYTCYRGGTREVELEPTVIGLHSESYGHSLLSSCEIDTEEAGTIPIASVRKHGYGYAVSINKADYRKGNAGRFFVIPPAQRSARFKLEDTFLHVRTRVHQPGPQEKTVHGMQNTAIEKVPYIVTNGTYSNAETFAKELRRYLDCHTCTLTG